MLNTRFSPWPSYSEEEVEAVARVLRSGRVNYWTGEEGRAFEEEFAAWCGVRHAVALANGTLALEVALRTLGVGAGDEVVVPARTFVATGSCVLACGAKPVFADVDADSQNLTAETVAAVLTPRAKAVICVHLAGWPCDMDPIVELCKARGLYLIEDCAQAHGARYKGRSVGAIGDIGCWSFCQDKIISTGGEGGMVTTDRADWFEAMWALKDHGKSWRAVHQREQPPGFRWLHESVGGNYRMTEPQAAIGRIQLRRLPAWRAARIRNAEAVWTAANQIQGLHAPSPGPGAEHAAYRAYVFVRPGALIDGWTRDRVVSAIEAEGAPCNMGSCSEIYLEKVFADAGLGPKRRLPVAKALGEESVAFLTHPTLKPSEIERTCAALRSVMARATQG
ncbi:MAG TPA: DegT/DnrJ/EryC1/StrS aminotransferase family protein [Roseiarcus sp.]|nr:DegT/DnrJ/EryC1/StrS aminotransferase family protein [Roseiarcus sp.]